MSADDQVNVLEAGAIAALHQTDGVSASSEFIDGSDRSREDVGASLEDDEFALRFSAAQVKSKVAQARYEAKVAADAELLAARKKLVERRYEVAEWERETKKVTTRCEDLQMRLDAVLQEHRNTLIGVREDLHLEKLLATLDMEKATREKLRQVFEEQQQDLTRAQERVEALDAQVANYQKTETVLAQSVAHLQHRFASKDQQRAASVEHVQRELVDQHEQEMVSMREELAIARRTEQMAQNQLQSLRKELKVLRDSSQQMMNSQESVVTHEQELKAKIAKLETEKAVLQSKAEQVQKADAQLRSQVHAHSEEIAALRLEKESLQRDNKELGEIASDLMQMAERQHADNVKRGVSPLRLTGDAAADTLSSTHDKDGVFLQKRKKRLRLSLG